MARSKSIPGSKVSRTSPIKEQPVTNAMNPDAMNSSEPKVTDVEAASPDLALEQKSVPETKPTPTAKVTPEPRKLEMVKNESRKNVVPINLEDEIRQRAFEIYQQRGSGAGSEAEDWLAAEREVRQRYRQQSA